MAGFFTGTPSGIRHLENYNPQQEQGANYALTSGMGLLQNPSQGFEPIRKSATDYYNQQILPGLAERFTGTGGAQSSPSFASLLGQAGAGFGSQLAGQEAQFAQNNRQQGLGLLQQGLQPYRTNYEQQGQGGFLEQYGPQIANLLELAGRAGLAYSTGGSSEAATGIMKLLQLLNNMVNPKEFQNYAKSPAASAISPQQ